MKFAIVIPSYNDAAGLWYTVAACLADLEPDFAPEEYEIIGVIDGPEDEATRVVHGMRQQGMCRIVNADTRTPQKNRHIGLLATEAPYVFFLDSHVIPSRGFFKRMVRTMEETGAALVHTAHCFWKRKDCGTAYGYHMDWKSQFWAQSAESEPSRGEAYRICLSGHGAICVDRAQYLETGGYWDALSGWGGEEPQLNLKLWLLGKEIYIEPRVYHWHFMPLKHVLMDLQEQPWYVRNFMLVAYASGGQTYLDAVHAFFNGIVNRHKTIEDAMAAEPKLPYRDLYEQVPSDAAEERAKICAGPFGGDIDKLREYFREERIPH